MLSPYEDEAFASLVSHLSVRLALKWPSDVFRYLSGAVHLPGNTVEYCFRTLTLAAKRDWGLDPWETLRHTTLFSFQTAFWHPPDR
jgi:hypothetical protein